MIRDAHLSSLLALLNATMLSAALSTAQQGAAAPAKPTPTPPQATLTPPHLAVGVDPQQVTELVVVFDRAMDQTAHALCGGGPSFPKVVRTAWRDERTFVATVELAGDQVYAMDLSCSGSGGFRSRDGVRVPPTPWRIATRGQPLAEGQAAETVVRLFRTIDEQYSYRERLGIDWAELERTHHDDLYAAPDGPALALRVATMLATAQDPHISVRWGESTLGTHQREVLANFDVRGVQKTFPKLSRIGRNGLAARTDDGIGYLFVGTFAREQRDDFEKVLDALRGLRDCKALVLDVRSNGGGDELLARRLAAWFVDGEKVYAAHRVRDPKAPNGFREPENRSLRGNAEPDVFAGEVAVLMGPLNMSSCEAFLLMMKQAPRAVLCGTESYGSSGNPQPYALLPGLTVLLPSWQALRPDGTMFEGEGISPHIHVAGKPEQFVDGDPVLAEALQRLRTKR